ncbi:hypothetical protein PVK06_020658 [Gossypium arboreum]|uniref:Uncharacterized protein n=1 Tax=Gossypium arboreum TaxID=29729 RepID=A0ABR0PMY3_GOSAR|nr:hypothetical protein PVK06_020658 [Gossypium arboreum]
MAIFKDHYYSTSRPNVCTSNDGHVFGVVAEESMTQSGTLLIKPDPEPERILRQAHQQMENNPPIMADFLQENPLFEENIELLVQVLREPLMAQPERTLLEYFRGCPR